MKKETFKTILTWLSVLLLTFTIGWFYGKNKFIHKCEVDYLMKCWNNGYISGFEGCKVFTMSHLNFWEEGIEDANVQLKLDSVEFRNLLLNKKP